MAINYAFFCLLFLGISTSIASATTITLLNNCPYTVWPGSLTGSGAPLLGADKTTLSPGAQFQVNPPSGWSGRFWARTGCNFDNSGAGTCATGDCGALQCPAGAGGVPPVSLAEFTLNGDGGKDFYDVSLVDGYNIGIGIRPTGGCQYAGCVNDLNKSCPPELQVNSGGAVVACKSACLKFNTPEYCCTGDHNTSATCPPTNYSKIFKAACPSAYSYAYDDASSTFTCTGADYVITFCPSS